jgi:hypothetical protein
MAATITATQSTTTRLPSTTTLSQSRRTRPLHPCCYIFLILPSRTMSNQIMHSCAVPRRAPVLCPARLSVMPQRLQTMLRHFQWFNVLTLLQAAVGLCSSLLWMVQTYSVPSPMIQFCFSAVLWACWLLRLSIGRLAYLISWWSVLEALTALPIVYSARQLHWLPSSFDQSPLSVSVDVLLQWLILSRFLLLYRVLRLRQVQQLPLMSQRGVVHGSLKLLLAMMLLLVLGGGLVFLLEGVCEGGQSFVFHQAAYFIFITVSTVGYGDYSAKSWEGQYAVMLIIAIALVVVPVACKDLIHSLSDDARYGSSYTPRGRGRHIVLAVGPLLPSYEEVNNAVCYLSHVGNNGLREVAIVLLCQGDEEHRRKLLYEMRKQPHRLLLHYVIGSPSSAVDLCKAAVRSAEAVFLLNGSRGLTVEQQRTADEETLLRTLSIKQHCPHVPVVMEMLSSASKSHPLWVQLRSLAASLSVVYVNEIRTWLLATSLTCPGSLRLLTQLVSPTVRPAPSLMAIFTSSSTSWGATPSSFTTPSTQRYSAEALLTNPLTLGSWPFAPLRSAAEECIALARRWEEAFLFCVGHRLHEVVLPACLAGLAFADAAAVLYEQLCVVLVSVRRDDQPVLSPGHTTVLGDVEVACVIAQSVEHARAVATVRYDHLPGITTRWESAQTARRRIQPSIAQHVSSPSDSQFASEENCIVEMPSQLPTLHSQGRTLHPRAGPSAAASLHIDASTIEAAEEEVDPPVAPSTRHVVVVLCNGGDPSIEHLLVRFNEADHRDITLVMDNAAAAVFTDTQCARIKLLAPRTSFQRMPKSEQLPLDDEQWMVTAKVDQADSVLILARPSGASGGFDTNLAEDRAPLGLDAAVKRFLKRNKKDGNRVLLNVELIRRDNARLLHVGAHSMGDSLDGMASPAHCDALHMSDGNVLSRDVLDSLTAVKFRNLMVYDTACAMMAGSKLRVCNPSKPCQLPSPPQERLLRVEMRTVEVTEEFVGCTYGYLVLVLTLEYGITLVGLYMDKRARTHSGAGCQSAMSGTFTPRQSRSPSTAGIGGMRRRLLQRRLPSSSSIPFQQVFSLPGVGGDGTESVEDGHGDASPFCVLTNPPPDTIVYASDRLHMLVHFWDDGKEDGSAGASSTDANGEAAGSEANGETETEVLPTRAQEMKERPPSPSRSVSTPPSRRLPSPSSVSSGSRASSGLGAPPLTSPRTLVRTSRNMSLVRAEARRSVSSLSIGEVSSTLVLGTPTRSSGGD